MNTEPLLDDVPVVNMDEVKSLMKEEELTKEEALVAVAGQPCTDDDFDETVRARIRSFVLAHGWEMLFFLLWMMTNAVLFVEYAFRIFREVLGTDEAMIAVCGSVANQNCKYFVTMAKGFGQILNFNCALILLPVCRNLLTAVRGTRLGGTNAIPFDSNIKFHKLVAMTILVSGAFHGMFHLLNYETRPVIDFGTTYQQSFLTRAGATGWAITLVMIAMYTTSFQHMRRKSFNLFYIVHHGFILFLVLLAAGHGPSFWKWLIPFAALYLCERALRLFRGNQKTILYKVILHPSNVVEIQLRSKRFTYVSGQYLLLNIPAISPWEWHPFTITSSPIANDYISFHIAVVGDWTRKMKELLMPKEDKDADDLLGEIVYNKEFLPNKTVFARIDGGFGASSQEVFDYETSVMIGAGIGVTPFCSLLRTILHRVKYPDVTEKKTNRLKRATFIWVTRTYIAVEWIVDILKELETDLVELELQDFLDIKIYLTGRLGKGDDELEQIHRIMHASNAKDTRLGRAVDPVTGLRSPTFFGRPNWGRIVSEFAETYPNEKVGFFFCGPPGLAKRIQNECESVTFREQKLGTKTRMVFNKENF